MWRPVMAAGIALLGLQFVLRALRRLPRAWRGDVGAAPPWSIGGRWPVLAQTYPAHLLWLIPSTAFGVMTATGLLLGGDPDAPGLLAELFWDATVGLALPMGVGILLALALDLTGRPQVLVPPPLRGDDTWSTAGWGSPREERRRRAEERRRRKAGRRRRIEAGLPATDHPVTLHDVRPLSDSGDSYPPYVIAICDEPGCDWFETADPGLSGRREGAQVRALAAQHSTRVAADLHRPLG